MVLPERQRGRPSGNSHAEPRCLSGGPEADPTSPWSQKEPPVSHSEGQQATRMIECRTEMWAPLVELLSGKAEKGAKAFMT